MSDRGTNVGGIYYTTTLETQGLIDGRRKVEQELKKAGDAGDGLKSRFSAIAAAISAAIAAIGVKHLVDELVRVQREFDVLSVQLKTAVGGSAELAASQMKRLQAFAQETPYGLEQVVGAFTKLVNLGLDPSERAMRSFGDTASAMGKPMMQLIEAVADAATGEFERLKEFGIKAKQEGSKVELTFKGVKTTVANNATAIQEYLLKLGETNFSGAMSERMKTLDGAVMSLKDTWEGLFLTVSQTGIGDAIAGAMRQATEAISQADASLRRGELTEYFDALKPALMAAEVAVVTLAGSIAGKLVTSLTGATAAFVSKTLAARAAAAQAVVTAEAELAAAVAAEREAVAQYGLTASLAAVTAASARTAAAQEALAVAQANAARQATVGSVAGGVFRGALAALGGPIGLAVAGLALLVFNWDKVSGAAKSAAEISEQAAGRIRAALSRTGGQPMKVLQDQTAEAAADLAKVDEQLKALRTGEDGQKITPFEQELLDRREALRGVVNDTKKAIDDLKQQQLDDLGFGNTPQMPAPPKAKQEPDKNALAKAQEARAYYEQMVAANAQGLAKINAEEQKALSENSRRMLEDKDNAGIYAKARSEIVAHFARERALLEEQYAQEAADLNIQTTTDEAARIEMIQAEAVRRTGEAEKLRTVTHEQAERARTLATFQAEQARAELAERNARARSSAAIASTYSTEKQITMIRDEEIRQAQDLYDRDKITFEELEAAKTQALMNEFTRRQQLQNGRTQTQIGTLQIKAESGGLQDQENLIREQAAAQMEAARQAQLLDLDNAQSYANQKVAIEARMNQQIADLRANANATALSSSSDMFGSLASIMKTAAGEQSGIYRAMFAASKAFAIAESIVKIQQGIANAAALPFPANIPAMAGVAAATASIVSTIAGTNYGGGRQYGGPVSAGSLYKVNEQNQPEMFVGSNGSQFMMPARDGRVVPADQVGAGGVQWTIILNNNAPGAVGTASVDQQARTVTLAVNEVASQLRSNSGPVSSALRSSWSATPRL